LQNVLVALADVALAAHHREAAGTHLLTNHLADPRLVRDDLLYQTNTEVTPGLLWDLREAPAATPPPPPPPWGRRGDAS